MLTATTLERPPSRPAAFLRALQAQDYALSDMIRDAGGPDVADTDLRLYFFLGGEGRRGRMPTVELQDLLAGAPPFSLHIRPAPDRPLSTQELRRRRTACHPADLGVTDSLPTVLTN